MVGEILRIKTSIPPLGTNVIMRPKILERLDEDLFISEDFTRQVTLISAPAGFGKTTLTRKWLAERENRTAWYSLDEGDNEPERFWIYLISALQTLNSRVGKAALEMLHLSTLSFESSTGNDSLLISLLNDLFALETPCFLVIDDYHLINNSRIHKDMVFFIEYLPPSIHLAVTTRSDPPWPLSKWRGRGNMLEVRMDELKFSQEEAGQLFGQSNSPRLTESQLAILYNKTEGWVTGLKLAAFSLATSSDADTFIDSFAGSHRHVFHFLTEEVFLRQPEPVQKFLLKTSFLNRFCVSLCNVVTDRDDSADVLAALERDNVFVIAMDDLGIWYRYHPLFSDLLFYQLKRNYSENVIVLQEKAVNWFLQAREFGEAIRHATKGNNYDTVGKILHDYYEEILKKEGPRQVNESLKSLPADLLEKYPRLIVQKALFNIIYKGTDETDLYIDIAEKLKYDNKKDQEEYTGLLAAIKTCYNVYCNNFSEALKNADKALKYLSNENNFWRMNVAIYSGDIRLFSGNPKGAYPFYLEALSNSQKLNNQYLSLTSGFKVSTSLTFLGRLGEAQEVTEKLLQTARDEGFSKLPRIGLLWTLLGELLREKGNLEEAERYIERGLFFSEPEKPSLGWNRLFKVALSFSQKDYEKALQTISEIEMDNIKYKLPHFITFPAAIWKARVLFETGHVSTTRELLSQSGILEETEILPGQEQGYLLLSRLLMGEYNNGIAQARKFLNRIEELAATNEHKKLLLETQLLKACLEEKTGNLGAAEYCLLSALQAGKESGYYQLFLDETKELAFVFPRIIEKLKSKTPSPINGDMLGYIIKICPSIFSEKNLTEEEHENKTGAKPKKPAGSFHQNLVEELSLRELEVLVLISRGLSNQDIAEKLFLSLGTVKWHTSNIYGKLGVRSRTQAASQARELKLLP